MRLGILLAVVALAACARPPKPLQGTFPPLSITQAQAGTPLGERVRWGGDIVSARPGRDATCFEIVAQPLDREARPRDVDATDGRFMACAPGFYDPAIYAPTRDVTVVGTLAEPVTRTVGEYDYRYPMVRAETVYLWPKREPPSVYYADPFYDPFWYPGPYFYPRGYFGFGLGFHGHGRH